MHERSKTHEKHSHMPDWFTESFFGQLVYRSTKRKVAWYPEEDDTWVVPEKYYRGKGQDIDVVGNYLEKQKKQQERAKEHQNYQEREDDEAQAQSEKKKKKEQKNTSTERQDSDDTAVRSSADSQDTAVATNANKTRITIPPSS